MGGWSRSHFSKDVEESAIEIDKLIDDEEERLPLRDQCSSVGDSSRDRGYFSEVGVGERRGEVASICVDVDVDAENLFEDTDGNSDTDTSMNTNTMSYSSTLLLETPPSPLSCVPLFFLSSTPHNSHLTS